MGTNLLLMTMGHISNVLSIKPNFKFKTLKCNQNFPSLRGTFSKFLFCFVYSVAGRITSTTCNTLGGGRVIIALKKTLTGLLMWG